MTKCLAKDESVAFDFRGYVITPEEDGVVTVDMQWHTSASQLKYVEGRIKAVASRIPNGRNEYETVKAVYDWLTRNVSYDHSLSEGCYSAYNGLKKGNCVCNGYASIFDRLCEAKMVPCHMVSGFLGSERHAWNIVKIDGKWYCCDPTVDAGNVRDGLSYDSFLCTFATRAYKQEGDDPADVCSQAICFSCKPATSDYRPMRKVTVKNGTGTGTYAVGKKLTIKAKVPKGAKFKKWTGKARFYKGGKYKKTAKVRVSNDTTLKAKWTYKPVTLESGAYKVRSKKGFLRDGAVLGKKKGKAASWMIEKIGKKFYIKNRKSGKYLSAKGEKIRMTKRKRKATKWILAKTSSNTYRIVKGTRAITVTADGLTLKQDKNAKSQRFRIK